MARKIKTIDLDTSSVVTSRDITIQDDIRSVDVNQVDGTILVTFPTAEDGSYYGSVVIYPQSSALATVDTIEINDLGQFQQLYYPTDARFNYIRRRIWICDSGNHRVLKVNRDTQDVEVAITNTIYFPHALAINFNDSSVWVKGYTDAHRNTSCVKRFDSNGTEELSFEFETDPLENSSSSSDTEVEGTTSSSSDDVFPELPEPYSVVYDHARSKVWWVNKEYVYMVDERYKSVQVYNLKDNGYYFTHTINVELETGNVLVVAGDNHGERFLVQIYKDNNLVLAESYIES